MTASIVPSTDRVAGRPSSERLLGLAPLVRKDVGAWAHGKRAWVILVITTLFMVLTAANGAITSWVVANAPEGAVVPENISLDPLQNLLAAVGSQFFVIVAIFAAMSLFVAEREHGTLAWVASKPVARAAIWSSAWVVAGLVISIAAGLVPLLVTVGVVVALYGPIPVAVVAAMAFGTAATVVFIVGVVMAASTVIRNQAAAAAIGFAVFFLPSLLIGFAPVDLVAWLPTSILPWAVGLATGAPVGFVTPIVWAVAVAVVAAFATWRMERIEP
jgi:ABC-type transport system involved in multi-copper enzyme maturation permease subunit